MQLMVAPPLGRSGRFYSIPGSKLPDTTYLYLDLMPGTY